MYGHTYVHISHMLLVYVRMCAHTVRMYIHNMHTYVCAYVANHGFVDIHMYIQYVPYVLHMHVYICHVLVSYSSLTTCMCAVHPLADNNGHRLRQYHLCKGLEVDL